MFNEEENNCKYISSRGFAKSCLIRSTSLCSSTYYIDDIVRLLPEAKANSTVYFCNTSITHYFNIIYSYIREPIILVTGDGDEIMDECYFKPILQYIESDKITKWYCQNCTYDHPKIIRLPIGLDLHSTQDLYNGYISPVMHDDILQNIAINAKQFHERIIQCYATFHFEIHRHPDRQDAVNKIPENIVFYEKTRTERMTSYKNQSQFAFVLSPRGGGFDCHRTWEALILGCIPVVKKSKHDPIYEDLPVLIVDDWSELTIELLQDTLEKFKNKSFNYDKLTLNYWKNKFETAT